MDLDMKICRNYGILGENLELVFLEFDHEIGHGICNNYIFEFWGYGQCLSSKINW